MESAMDPLVAEMLRPLSPAEWLLGQWLVYRAAEAKEVRR